MFRGCGAEDVSWAYGMNLLHVFKKKNKPPASGGMASLEKVVFHFSELLKENNETLELMADLEEKADGHFLFDMTYLRSTVSRINEKVDLVAEHLIRIAPNRYEDLKESYQRIHEAIEKKLSQKKGIPPAAYTIPLEEITLDHLDQTGGKNAHLGEVKNILGLPTPEGFAISTFGYMQFLTFNHFQEKILSLLQSISLKDNRRLEEAEKEVREMILQASIPPDMEKAISEASQKMKDHLQEAAALALRSSAILEDSHFSFAGQYATFLNIGPEEIGLRYKEIVASQFNARALFYMKSKGLIEEDMAMAVACQQLVFSKASGVLFTSHFDPDYGESVLINGLWGLGKWVVDGTISPDLYLLDKKTGHLKRQEVSHKTRQLIPGPQNTLKEDSVPEALQDRPCLNAGQLTTLWEWSRRLEDHFGHPQDVEWTMDQEDRLIILQTRNLRGFEKLDQKKVQEPISPDHPLLLAKGSVGAFGIGSGPVFKVGPSGDLTDFPKGAVLVAGHTSSKFVSVMDKASAIVTDIGSATGHMAILAREFHVPTLVDTEKATALLEQGQVVTVDAFHSRVYAGRVEPLLEELPKQNALFLNTPVYGRLKEVIRDIVPLNLIDPKLESFKPSSCLTLHDIIRFAHEKSIEEMFNLSEREDLQKISAIQIKTSLPFNLHLLDLGGGLKKAAGQRIFSPEDVVSVPFTALWKGITTLGISWAGPIGVNVKGLLSVMAQSATQSSEDFWDRTLALVSSNYLNYSSRLGYHFTTIDSYCGPLRNNNYITFVFKGGGADVQRRGRRARFLGMVLEELGFEVLIKEDMVKAEYRKYPQEMIEEKLGHLGRLMGCARQLDMTMSDETMVNWYAQAFLSGNYAFQKNGP
jgi:pyruvate, water dikinase